MMNKRFIGSKYENMASNFLEKNSCKIIEKNFRSHHGEIDLIMMDGEVLVFVEVKYRTTMNYGSPFEAVDIKKQLRIRTTAKYYLYKMHYGDEQKCRFDVIGILGEKITWLKNAF